MIKIQKNPIPEILRKNQAEWTKLLIDKWIEVGKVYADVKESYKIKYQKKEIFEALNTTDENNENPRSKCAYCEQYTDIQVEHYLPQYLHPDLVYNWNNFIPACSRCNLKKGKRDPIQNKIINPSQEDPEKYFDYDDIFICPSKTTPDNEKSENTIKILELNRTSLIPVFCDVYASYMNSMLILKNTLNIIENGGNKTSSRLSDIQNGLHQLKKMAKKNQQLAGFIRYLNKTRKWVIKAKELIES